MNAPSRRRLTLAVLVLSAVPATAALAATPPDQIDRLTHHVTVTTLGSTQRVVPTFTTPYGPTDIPVAGYARPLAKHQNTVARSVMGPYGPTDIPVAGYASPLAKHQNTVARSVMGPYGPTGIPVAGYVRRAHVLP